MIEKMQMVHIVTTTSGKQEMLEGLRDIGILHLSEKKSADKAAADRVLAISKAMTSLKEYKTGKGGNPQILSDEAFEKLLGEVQGALERKAALIQEANVPLETYLVDIRGQTLLDIVTGKIIED